MKSDYEKFEILMDEERIFLDRSLSFSDICHATGINKDALEGVLIEELGLGGDDLLAIYRGFRAP